MPSNPSLLISPKQREGGYYEQLAAEFLTANGLQIIGQNWQQPNVGEIDLVLLHPAKAWDTLVFAEVRKRRSRGFGDAFMSVTAAKQRKLIKTARYFLQQHPNYAHLECRFDVVGFNLSSKQGAMSEPVCLPEWIQGAFISRAW